MGRFGWAGVGPLNLVFYNRVESGIGPSEVSLPGGGWMWLHVIIKKNDFQIMILLLHLPQPMRGRPC